MNNLLIFIKLNCSAPAVQPAISFVEDSYNNQHEHFYYTSDKDTQTIRDLLSSMKIDNLVDYYIAFIEYRKMPEIFIKKLYIGKTVRLEQQGNSYQIYYSVKNEITSSLVIDNFMKYSNLNIERDFEEDSHISIEDSAPLMKQLLYAVNKPQNIAKEAIKYPHIEAEEKLSEFAQRNEYCLRFFNIFPSSETRSEYQRDYDRLVHSKAFRRMVDKAQIFTSSKGDHYRTRMTHTLCVAQIARSIASRLHMNVPLTEAIALGHDLGHTPFGHQGERTLDKMARDCANIGFKHNFQSLNVASVLEEEYIECSGLDLSVQVLEGMWKHTKIRKSPHDALICDLEEFLPYGISEEARNHLHPENSFCSTVEGQIVFIADEIAQRSHDLDDALSARLLTMDNVIEALSLKKLHTLKAQIEELKSSIYSAQKGQRMFVSERELLVSRVASQVINYFIDDVVKCFEDFLAQNCEEVKKIRAFFKANSHVDRQVLHFSAEGQILNDYLETIVAKQVINSPEVAAFDDKAKRVVSKLFELYYDNPRLLHDGTLQRIFIETRKRTNNVIHFQDADIDLVNDEWKRIKNPSNASRFRDLREEFPSIDFTPYQSVPEFKDSLDETSKEYSIVTEYLDSCLNEYREKQKILVRSICDFISGMTDTYATEEYRKLLY